jgi:branched-chain amino acid transport system substrate-binding protein
LVSGGVNSALVLDSATMGITVPALHKAGVPVVGGFLSSPLLLGKLSNVWALYPSLGPLVTVIVDAAKAAGFTRGAVLECTVEAACSAADAPLKQALGAAGLKWEGAIPYSITAANFTAPCLSAMGKGADFIQVSAPSSIAQRIMTDCRTQGYKGSFSSNVEVVNAANALQVANNTIVGALLAFPWFADAAPVKTYTDAMKKYGVQDKYWQDNGAANVWASLELLRKVLNSNKAALSATVTPAEVINAYGTVKDETLGGLLPQPVTFTANQPQAPITCGFTYELKGGTYKTLKDGLSPSCPSS